MFEWQVTVGGSVSTTVTVKLHELTPVEFEAVQTTLLVPMRNPVPLGGVQMTATGPLASEAVAVNVTGVRPPVHSATTLVEQTISGVAPPATTTFSTWPSAWAGMAVSNVAPTITAVANAFEKVPRLIAAVFFEFIASRFGSVSDTPGLFF